MSALWSLLGDKRTLGGHRQTVENDPKRTLVCRRAVRRDVSIRATSKLNFDV
jgi:hypothetical protein